MIENKHYLITYIIEGGIQMGCVHFIHSDSHDARWVESYITNPDANRGALISMLLALEVHTNKDRSIYMKADKVVLFKHISLTEIDDVEARKYGYIR